MRSGVRSSAFTPTRKEEPSAVVTFRTPYPPAPLRGPDTCAVEGDVDTSVRELGGKGRKGISTATWPGSMRVSARIDSVRSRTYPELT